MARKYHTQWLDSRLSVVWQGRLPDLNTKRRYLINRKPVVKPTTKCNHDNKQMNGCPHERRQYHHAKPKAMTIHTASAVYHESPYGEIEICERIGD